MGAFKTHTTSLRTEKDISVFEIETGKAEKVGEVDSVSIFDRADNRLIEDLYADLPTLRTYEKLLEKKFIPPDTEIRLGLFFEADYPQMTAKMYYLWYMKFEGGQIHLLTSPVMSEKMRKAEKERRLFFSGFDIVRGRTVYGDRVEIEQNAALLFKTERICIFCGKRFAPEKHHKNDHKFCSRSCYRKHYYKTRGK
jgi:hypothetical protein